MTVRCLTEAQKNAVIELYQLHAPPNALAVLFRRSERTIGRVLTEFGMAPIRTTKPKPTNINQLALFPEPTPYQLFKASFQALAMKQSGATCVQIRI